MKHCSSRNQRFELQINKMTTVNRSFRSNFDFSLDYFFSNFCENFQIFQQSNFFMGKKIIRKEKEEEGFFLEKLIAGGTCS